MATDPWLALSRWRHIMAVRRIPRLASQRPVLEEEAAKLRATIREAGYRLDQHQGQWRLVREKEDPP